VVQQGALSSGPPVGAQRFDLLSSASLLA